MNMDVKTLADVLCDALSNAQFPLETDESVVEESLAVAIVNFAAGIGLDVGAIEKHFFRILEASSDSDIDDDDDIEES
jgi:NhaP-type Na+/H+ or K+/H+ antiporter